MRLINGFFLAVFCVVDITQAMRFVESWFIELWFLGFFWFFFWVVIVV